MQENGGKWENVGKMAQEYYTAKKKMAQEKMPLEIMTPNLT